MIEPVSFCPIIHFAFCHRFLIVFSQFWAAKSCQSCYQAFWRNHWIAVRITAMASVVHLGIIPKAQNSISLHI